jgi:hypothetical protein
MMTSIGTGTQNVIVFGRSLPYGRTLRLENYNNQFLVRLIYLYQHLNIINSRILLKLRDNYHFLNSSGVMGVIGKDLDNRILSSSENQLITALCVAGALCGVVVAEATADKYGPTCHLVCFSALHSWCNHQSYFVHRCTNICR